MNEKLRIGALVSGVGSNLTAILDTIERNELNAEVRVVISNKKSAPAIEKATERGIPAHFVDPAPFKSLQEYDRQIVRLLQESDTEWVVLAGYMKLVSEELLSAYPNRVLNIHPSLLPAFPGLQAQKQALDYGVKITGCTVHLVDAGLDSGPIIVQAAVPVLEGDSLEKLKERILEKEHQIYPLALKWITEKRIKIEGRKVLIQPTGASS